MSTYNNIFMFCSCHSYDYRYNAMLKIYKKYMQKDDKIIVLLGSEKTVLNNDILELNCGDLYENLPEKVVLGIQYIYKHFKFNKLIKVDDDVVINFKKYYEIINNLPNEKLYYGRSNPPGNKVLPSNVWHINKCSKTHIYNDKPFPDEFFIYNREEPIQWPSGGIYVLSNDVCEIVNKFSEEDMNVTKRHLYEDLNLRTLLHKYNIEPTLDKSQMNKNCSDYFLVVLPDEIVKNKSNLKNTSFDNEFYNKYSNIKSYHIGSLAPSYSINKEEYIEILSILNKFNT